MKAFFVEHLARWAQSVLVTASVEGLVRPCYLYNIASLPDRTCWHWRKIFPEHSSLRVHRRLVVAACRGRLAARINTACCSARIDDGGRAWRTPLVSTALSELLHPRIRKERKNEEGKGREENGQRHRKEQGQRFLKEKEVRKGKGKAKKEQENEN